MSSRDGDSQLQCSLHAAAPLLSPKHRSAAVSEKGDPKPFPWDTSSFTIRPHPPPRAPSTFTLLYTLVVG